MNDNMIPNAAGSPFTADMIAAGAPVIKLNLPKPNPEFDTLVADHYEWCDECDAPAQAFWHEQDARENPNYINEAPC